MRGVAGEVTVRVTVDRVHTRGRRAQGRPHTPPGFRPRGRGQDPEHLDCGEELRAGEDRGPRSGQTETDGDVRVTSEPQFLLAIGTHGPALRRYAYAFGVWNGVPPPRASGWYGLLPAPAAGDW